MKFKKLRIATVFSGIGAPEQALKKMGIDYKIIFACDNGEREIIDNVEEVKSAISEMSFKDANKYVKSLYAKSNKPNYMKKSYFANYEISEDDWYEDIRFLNGNAYKGKVDILIGGSPCQSFSNIGKRAGLEDTRGTLFYDYARLINEITPKAFVYENVPGMLNHDKGNTWKVIYEVFCSLGYKVKYQLLNSKDYGIPQDRKRLFVVGIRENLGEFEFPDKQALTTSMFDYLEANVEPKFYLGKKGFEFVTNNPGRAKVNQKIIRTQKANQQFNWNGDFVFVDYEKIKNSIDICNRAYIGEWNDKIGAIRQLTHRECLRLMGFSDDFEIVVPNVWAYRQSGNSIVVNVLEAVFGKVLEAIDYSSKVRIATVFSGIGAPEFALRRLGIEAEVIFACDNGERDVQYDKEEEFNKVKSLSSIDEKKKYVDNLYSSKTNKKNYMEISYLANYPELDKNRFFQDIVLLDGTDFENKVDLFVGGSPCQSFSSVGYQGGLEDARGTLFYEFARLVKEIKPKVFIYENVRNLLNHDKGKTWKVIQSIFDTLGYKYKFDVLNSADYGIPQNRRRLFVVGYKEDCEFNMPEAKELPYEMKDFTINKCAFGSMSYDDNGAIKLEKKEGIVEDTYTLSPLIYKYVMSGGTKTFYQKPEINKTVARTLLKTMGNRHRAGIDNYVSFDGTTNIGSVRMLTEREVHRLMGFTDDYKIVVSRAQAYKQAGNSMVVDVMMEIIKKIAEQEIL